MSDNVVDLIDDYLSRLRQGETPDVDEICLQYPDFEAEIRRYLPIIAVIEHAAETKPVQETITSEATETNTLEPGENFGRYLIQRELGQGGMGTVYQALDTQLNRKVAIKIPRFDQNDSDASTRFQREARAMAQVSHRNLCQVYDVGDVDGQHFISMEFIEGKTLKSAILERGRFSNDAAAQVVRELATALHVAHQTGLIHRDLKPANIMLDAEGVPMIMDFGLAKQIVVEETEITEVGTIVGSPTYMAPEQLDSQENSIDQRADIYGLGIILYELLCGRPPFVGSTLSVLSGVVSRTPPRMSELLSTVDPKLEAICLKAISKSPADRYQSAQELAEQLTKLIDLQEKLETVSKPELGLVSRLPTQWSLLAVGFVILIVIAVMLRPATEAPKPSMSGPPEQLAETHEEDHSSRSSEATLSKDSLDTLFKISSQDIGDSNTNRVALGDLDGDGDLDAFVSNWDSQNRLWLNNGQGEFTESEQAFGQPGKQSNMSIAIGDIDGDGDNDILAGGLRIPITLWINDNNEKFVARIYDHPEFVLLERYDLLLHDFDHDQDLDVFWTCLGAPDQAWLNDGQGNFDTRHQLLDNQYSDASQIADFNEDGHTDIATGCFEFKGAKIWLNDGNATFSEGGNVGDGVHGGAIVLADMNGDQHTDISLINSASGGSTWFNDGSGSFSENHDHSTIPYGIHFASADFDNDGDFDLLTGCKESKQPSLNFNNGSGRFERRQLYPPQKRCHWIATGDLDNDGDIDAFFANVGPNKVWLNQAVK